ncbi:neuron navigator [Nesidiocoris tenuis]|uniref:Neuron navigator n=1 Tax=Nesidiocoris tenuis TaxID=355587 RepID=A0ABN7AMX9_9HEMI|nr:neuron navigator [Nesidiocoris tenuis]
MDGIQSLNEPLRVAGGGSGLPKVLGIPKPTAVVKGYPKPTHPVAPMPPATNPPTPLYATFDKEKSVHKTAETNGDCRKPGQPPLKSEKLEVVLEKSHERQVSLEESEDGANVKPMQPLLPGYNKRSIAILPRTIPLNRNRAGGYRPLDTYPRSNTERNFAECDFGSPSASGYMSDGDVLHVKSSDVQDGYLSEGGASLSHRAERR